MTRRPAVRSPDGLFRAARFGVHGELPDAHGGLRPVSEILQDTPARVEGWGSELGCVQELAQLPDLLRRGGGAGVQRAIYDLAGIDGLTKQLTDLTAAAAKPDIVPELPGSASIDPGETTAHRDAASLRAGPAQRLSSLWRQSARVTQTVTGSGTIGAG